MAKYLALMPTTSWANYVPAGTTMGDGTPFPLTGDPSPGVHQPLDADARTKFAAAVARRTGPTISQRDW